MNGWLSGVAGTAVATAVVGAVAVGVSLDIRSNHSRAYPVISTQVHLPAHPTPARVDPATPDYLGMTPHQRHITEVISDEWNLGRHYTAIVVRAAFASAERYSLDPVLLLAMAAKESSFRHIGNPGGGVDPMRPYGIMQVAGKYHKDLFDDGVVRPTNVVENMEMGAKVVREYLDVESGDERRALLRYNGSLNKSDSYFDGVSRLRRKLLQAFRRGNSAAA